MTHETGRLLYKFLQEKGAYRRYLWNYWNNRGKERYDKFPNGNKEAIIGILEKYGIFSGFTWCDTPEGDNFWSKLHHQFDIYLYRRKIRNKPIEAVRIGRSTHSSLTDEMLRELP